MAAPETLEDYAARLVEAAGADGRPVLAPDGLTSWDVFPFEADGVIPRTAAAPSKLPSSTTATSVRSWSRSMK